MLRVTLPALLPTPPVRLSMRLARQLLMPPLAPPMPLLALPTLPLALPTPLLAPPPTPTPLPRLRAKPPPMLPERRRLPD